MTGVYFKLLMVSALLQLTFALPSQKLAPERKDPVFRKNYILEKLFQTSKRDVNLCRTSVNDVNTSTLDKGSKGIKYIPAKFREVSCLKQKATCCGSRGNCIDIETKIKVKKVMNDLLLVPVTISLKVGCACFRKSYK